MVIPHSVQADLLSKPDEFRLSLPIDIDLVVEACIWLFLTPSLLRRIRLSKPEKSAVPHSGVQLATVAASCRSLTGSEDTSHDTLLVKA